LHISLEVVTSLAALPRRMVRHCRERNLSSCYLIARLDSGYALYSLACYSRRVVVEDHLFSAMLDPKSKAVAYKDKGKGYGKCAGKGAAKGNGNGVGEVVGKGACMQVRCNSVCAHWRPRVHHSVRQVRLSPSYGL
jgi:hypothetical protein